MRPAKTVSVQPKTFGTAECHELGTALPSVFFSFFLFLKPPGHRDVSTGGKSLCWGAGMGAGVALGAGDLPFRLERNSGRASPRHEPAHPQPCWHSENARVKGRKDTPAQKMQHRVWKSEKIGDFGDADTMNADEELATQEWGERVG